MPTDPIFTAIVLLVGFGDQVFAQESGHQKAPAITIVDQRGRAVKSGAPSATTQQFAVTVAPGGERTFSPSTVTSLPAIQSSGPGIVAVTTCRPVPRVLRMAHFAHRPT